MSRKKEPVTPRFWSKVQKAGPDDCWEWVAGKGGRGYGMFWLDGKQVKAHRVAWMLENGPIPPGKGYHGTCVLHSCDNPPCVNPAHLFIGSNAVNQADMRAKGREVNSSELRAVRLLFRGKDQTITEWAAELGIARGTITQRLAAGWSVDRALAEPATTGKRFLTHAGKRLSVAQWSRLTGIPYGTIHMRIQRYGWSVERALTTPSRRRV